MTTETKNPEMKRSSTSQAASFALQKDAKLINSAEMCKIFRCGHDALRSMERSGRIPAAIRVGTSKMWSAEAITKLLLGTDKQKVKQPSLPPQKPLAQPKQLSLSSEKTIKISDAALDLWASCLAVSGTAEAYLKSRRCRIPPADGHLRWHPSLRHPNGYTGPCLVALITHAQTGEPLSLHRTWITETGEADVGNGGQSRLPLGGVSDVGVIRLWLDDYVINKISIANGIYNALSLAWAYPPVWAMVGNDDMAAFPVLAGIECLTIARDRDPAGERAAKECYRRWKEAGVTVGVTAQKENNFNEVLMTRMQNDNRNKKPRLGADHQIN